MIYFIAAADRSRIKIGTTIRLSQRLKQLVAEHGEGLQVLAVIEGGRSEERALHARFASARIVGEWFEPGDDLIGFIVDEGRAWDDSDITKPVRLDLDPDDHHLLRMVAASHGLSMAAYAREALANIVRDEAKRRGIKP